MAATSPEDTRKVLPVRCAGFSLIELLVVLLVLGLLVGAVAQPLSTVLDQNRYDKTACQVEEIRRAIFGDPEAQARGNFRGFTADMGCLPVAANATFVQSLLWVSNTTYFPDMEYFEEADEVCHNGGAGIRRYRCIRSNTANPLTNQPGDIFNPSWVQYWQDLNATCTIDNWIPGGRYRRETRLDCGWNGPYLPAPAGGKLLDGWGNPLEFDHNATTGVLTITSLGADGMAGSANNETFDHDRSWMFYPSQYRGRLTAQVTVNITNATDDNLTQSTNATTLALHCPNKGKPGVWRYWDWGTLPFTAVNATKTYYLPADGPFTFHQDASAEDINGTAPMSQDPPVGLCTLSAVLVYDDGNSSHLQQEEILFPVALGPGANAAVHQWNVTFDD